MALRIGSGGDEAGMAGAIETAFRTRWAQYQQASGLPGVLPDTAVPMLRLVFESVAAGVLKHLRDHLPDEGAVGMSVTVRQTQPAKVASANAAPIPVTRVYVGAGEAWQVDSGVAAVRQTDDAIESEGAPVIGSVQVDDLP